ncbi:AAA family ATPase [Fulvivirga sp. M361]|uniref:GumC family protein n=1 Tax=Fulvivirga sp. M361 TaxID=2594266 RepID=UPI00117B22F1|nr:AAA family ATPase [Fulvivirga sp. M361]TRX60106.1 AAA family ATPase [Fulvivirga sp. M361]
MDLTSIFKLLLRKLWIIIIVPIIAGVAAFFFTLNLEKQYKSTAQLATGFTTNDRIKLTEERFSRYESTFKFSNMMETMNSELVMSLLSYRLMIEDLTTDIPLRNTKANDESSLVFSQAEIDSITSFFKEKLDNMEVLSNYDEYEKGMSDLLKEYGYVHWKLSDKISIKRVNNTDYVTIQAVTVNPVLSSFIVNTLAEEYIRYDNSLKNRISNESVTFFSSLVEEKKKVLDEKTRLLNEYKANNNLFVEDQTGYKTTQIAEYELLKQEKLDRMRGLRLSIENTNKWLAKIQEGSSEVSVASLNNKILQIRKKINDLNQIYVNSGSNDDDLLNTINNLRNDLQIEMNKLAASQSGTQSVGMTKEELIAKRDQFQLELEIEQGSLGSLNSTIATLKSSVSGSITKEATISALEREISTASDEYLQALNKLNTEKNKSLIADSSIKIIIRGQPNGAPESSKVPLIIALGVASSFGICIFVLVFIEFIDMRIKNASRFESLAGINLLGSINRIQVKNLDLRSLFNRKVADPSREQYKHLLRKIRFEIENSNAKIILVTSTKPNEGKTFCILSIVYSLSLLNKRILIVDTNFRNNSLTELLIAKPNFQKMIEQTSGTRLLSSPEVSEDPSENLISKTNDKNIDVIGSNAGLESPSEILAGRDFMGMLEHLRDQYDYIFLEGASLNEYSDSKELMKFVDKVIPVFSANTVLKQIDRSSISYLKNLNGKLMGAILNKIEAQEVLS